VRNAEAIESSSVDYLTMANQGKTSTREKGREKDNKRGRWMMDG
jgi:hypothetical protein